MVCYDVFLSGLVEAISIMHNRIGWNLDFGLSWKKSWSGWSNEIKHCIGLIFLSIEYKKLKIKRSCWGGLSTYGISANVGFIYEGHFFW